MNTAMTQSMLKEQNDTYRGSRGVSEGCKDLGYVPAFHDADTGETCRSQFADGRPAPMHLLDGLPESWILRRNAHQRVTQVKASIIAGFLRNGCFYTRGQVANASLA